MNSRDLKVAIQVKTHELEMAMETGKPKNELLELYKQLKELHYMLVRAEAAERPEQLV